MPTNNQHRSVIVNELSMLSVPQLNEYFISVVGEPLANHVVTETNVRTVVSNLIDFLENVQKVELFLDKVSDSAGRIELTAAVNEFLNRTPKGSFNALVVMNGRPFVDRSDLRPTLDILFNNPSNYYRVLIIKGNRYSGRSHSNLLIQHIAQSTGFLVKKIDLLDFHHRPLRIEDIISKFINIMGLESASRLKDTIALASAQSAGLADFIVNWLGSDEGGRLKSWCFVFDSYDREEVLPESQEFVDALMYAIVDSSIANAWLVVLGRDQEVHPIFPNVSTAMLQEEIKPLTPLDIKTYISEFSKSKDQLLTDQNMNSLCDAVIEGLVFPLNKEHMGELESRLINYVRSN